LFAFAVSLMFAQTFLMQDKVSRNSSRINPNLAANEEQKSGMPDKDDDTDDDNFSLEVQPNDDADDERLNLEDLELLCSTAGSFKPAECTDENFEKARKEAAISRKLNSSRKTRQKRSKIQSHKPKKTDAPREVNVRELHSSHSCYGRDSTDENWKRATCLYHDLCHFEQKWYYIARNEFERKHVEDLENPGGNDNHLAVSLAPLGVWNKKFEKNVWPFSMLFFTVTNP